MNRHERIALVTAGVLMVLAGIISVPVFGAQQYHKLTRARFALVQRTTGTQTVLFSPGVACELKEVRFGGTKVGVSSYTYTNSYVAIDYATSTGIIYDTIIRRADNATTSNLWWTWDPGPTLEKDDGVSVSVSASATTVGVICVFEIPD